MNRIHTSLIRTAILSGLRRASIGANALHRCIGNKIAITIARVAFESMQESQPVARLMDGSTAFIVATDRAAWHGTRGYIAAVGDVDAGRGAGRDFRGKGAGSENAAGEVRVEVEVEVGVGSHPQGSFESVHVGTCSDSPGVVGGERGVDQVEGDANGVVGCVHGGSLVSGHLGSDGIGFSSGGDDMEVGVYGDGLLGLAADESGWGAGAHSRRLVFLVKGLDGAFEVLCCLAVVDAAGMAAVDVGGVSVDEVSLVRC